MKINILTLVLWLYIEFSPTIVWLTTVNWYNNHRIQWLELKTKIINWDNERLRRKLMTLRNEQSSNAHHP